MLFELFSKSSVSLDGSLKSDEAPLLMSRIKPRGLREAQRCVQGPSSGNGGGRNLRQSLRSVPNSRRPLSVCLPPSRFDSELTQALEGAENEREQKDKVSQENAALGAEIYTLRRSLQVRQQILFIFSLSI